MFCIDENKSAKEEIALGEDENEAFVLKNVDGPTDTLPQRIRCVSVVAESVLIARCSGRH
jgi:hypothetical protein